MRTRAVDKFGGFHDGFIEGGVWMNGERKVVGVRAHLDGQRTFGDKFACACADDAHTQYQVGNGEIMYGIDGRKELTEETLGHLEGYRGSRPVRIGNAAYGQLQLDIYGELMDAVYLYNKYGAPISYEFWKPPPHDGQRCAWGHRAGLLATREPERRLP